jgi:hypothetical protein
VSAIAGIVTARKPKVYQGVQIDVCNCIHVTAASAVTTIGSAKLFVLFMAERDAASPAIARCNVNKGFVYKFHDELKYR